MGYRIFTDSQGVEWQTWDIVPKLAERRGRDRRTMRMAFDPERRKADERRLAQIERPALTRGLDGGWLSFEAPVEKRRLAPIPPDWQRCAVVRLEEYLRAAVPAPRSRNLAKLPVIVDIDRRVG